MLISVSSFRKWLRDNADKLRTGGAPSTADVYDDIESQLAAEVEDIVESDREELQDARQLAANVIPPKSLQRLERAGLMVVPSDWRQG